MLFFFGISPVKPISLVFFIIIVLTIKKCIFSHIVNSRKILSGIFKYHFHYYYKTYCIRFGIKRIQLQTIWKLFRHQTKSRPVIKQHIEAPKTKWILIIKWNLRTNERTPTAGVFLLTKTIKLFCYHEDDSDHCYSLRPQT